MSVKAILEERAKLVADARAILDNPKAEAEQLANADTMLVKAQELQTRARKLSDIDAFEASLQVEPQAFAGGKQDKGLQNEYNDVFFAAVRSGDFGELRNFRNAQSVGTNTAGGYTVPTEFERMLEKDLVENNVMRRLCKISSTSSDKIIPVLTDRGTAAWGAEAAAFTQSDLAFAQKTLSAHKLNTLTLVSEELLQDSAFDIAAELSEAFAVRFGKAEEEAFLTGAGAGSNQPLGLIGQTTAGKSGTAGSISFDDLKDLKHSLTAPYRVGASWLMNDSIFLAISKIKDSQGQYILNMNVTAGEPETLLGKPVYFSEFMDNALTATKKPVLFGNFKKYEIGDRKGRTMQRLNELYAVNGQVGFRMYQRVDTVLRDDNAIKHLVMV